LAQEKIIAGIDPGTSIMGYGILEVKSGSVSIMSMGIVDLRKCPDHYIKLKSVFDATTKLLEQFNPDELAIEAPFFGKNVQSMLKLGRAQGAAIAAALQRSIPIFEYAPRKIKLAITGNGNASKEQVAEILKQILKFQKIPKNLDATDGVAAALCHHFNHAPNKKSSYKSWTEFISKNPDRLK